MRGHLSHGLGLDHYTRWPRAALPSCRQRVPGSARPRALIGACQGATSGGMCHRFQMGKACPIAQANRYGHGSRDSWHEWHVVQQFQQLGNRQGKQRLGGERASVRRRAGPHAGGSRIAQVSDCHQRCAQRYFSVAQSSIRSFKRLHAFVGRNFQCLSGCTDRAASEAFGSPVPT